MRQMHMFVVWCGLVWSAATLQTASASRLQHLSLVDICVCSGPVNKSFLAPCVNAITRTAGYQRLVPRPLRRAPHLTKKRTAHVMTYIHLLDSADTAAPMRPTPDQYGTATP